MGAGQTPGSDLPVPPRGRMTRRAFVARAGSVAALAGTGVVSAGCAATAPPLTVQRTLRLPEPQHAGDVSLQEALAHRRSRREFADRALSERQISQLLWAAQGVTADWGGRTSPSAGALYPLELYAATSRVYGRYRPQGHLLDVLAERDLRADVAAAALHQAAVRTAALALVFGAVFARETRRYGSRGRRYTQLEAGHAAQNVLLQAVALGLAAVPIGAFDDARLKDVLRLPRDQTPLYIVAVAYPRGR